MKPNWDRVPSRASSVAEYVEKMIAGDGLQPGDLVGTKAQLQSDLKVARSTINEALKILVDRGTVTAKSGPGGGLFVADPNDTIRLRDVFTVVRHDATRIHHAMALRDQIEPMILREACIHHSAEDVKDLREIVARASSLLEARSRTPLTDIWRIHARIGQITPNTFLSTTYLGLIDYLSENMHADRVESASATQLAFDRERIAAHSALVELIAAADIDDIERVITLHDDFTVPSHSSS